MSEALPDDAQLPIDPEPEARTPVPPPMQGMAPAWVDPAEQPALGQIPAFEPDSKGSTHGFTLERGGRHAMADTAERIGSVVGSAQRQVRRGIELVRRPAIHIGAASTAVAADAAERAAQIAQEGVDRAAHAMEDIKGELLDARLQAARRLDEWSEEVGQRFQQLRYQARHALSRSREGVQEVAEAYPLRTIVAVAGVCFAMGVALRLRRSRRG